MSRILFDAFELAGVTGTAAVDIAADFSIQAVGLSGNGGSIAVDITADFIVAGVGAGVILIDITNDFVIAAVGTTPLPLVFEAPAEGETRVAIVTHSN